MGEQEQELRRDEHQVEDDQDLSGTCGGRRSTEREPAPEGQDDGAGVPHRPGPLEQEMGGVLPQGDQNRRDEREGAEDKLQSSGTEPFSDDHADQRRQRCPARRRPIRESRSSDPPSLAGAAYNFLPTRLRSGLISLGGR
jgi:hypothetical protein